MIINGFGSGIPSLDDESGWVIASQTNFTNVDLSSLKTSSTNVILGTTNINYDILAKAAYVKFEVTQNFTGTITTNSSYSFGLQLYFNSSSGQYVPFLRHWTVAKSSSGVTLNDNYLYEDKYKIYHILGVEYTNYGSSSNWNQFWDYWVDPPTTGYNSRISFRKYGPKDTGYQQGQTSHQDTNWNLYAHSTDSSTATLTNFKISGVAYVKCYLA